MKQPVPAGLNRRQFLRQTAVIATAPLIVPGAVLGLNGSVSPGNRITFGGIGFGNRARHILPNFLSFPEIRFLAMSDCRAPRLQGGKEFIDAHYRNTDCRTYADFRELLGREEIDAVFIAIGNRWHGLASIYAARARKDIYCEKPVTLTIREGRNLVETCRRFGVVYQAGTQRRATDSYAFAREMVRQGKIGKLKRVEMQVWTGAAIPHEKPTDPPPDWDYDVWLGQTPYHPFVPARVNAWQYFWDTAEGMLTDMGVHYTDQMQWVLGTDDTGPVRFEAKGELPDPRTFMSDTPTTAEARCWYRDGVEGVIYQRAGFTDRYLRYVGEEGWIQVDDETDAVKAEPASILRHRKPGGLSWANASAHIGDLLDCIRSRRQPTCNPEVAHRAITICQAMNISLRLGRELKWDTEKEEFDVEAANRMLWREPRAPWRA